MQSLQPLLYREQLHTLRLKKKILMRMCICTQRATSAQLSKVWYYIWRWLHMQTAKALRLFCTDTLRTRIEMQTEKKKVIVSVIGAIYQSETMSTSRSPSKWNFTSHFSLMVIQSPFTDSSALSDAVLYTCIKVLLWVCIADYSVEGLAPSLHHFF